MYHNHTAKYYHKSIKLRIYFNCEFLNLLLVSTFAVIKTNNGFKISIGCNLNKYKSSHLLAPFTSCPNIGTNANNKKDIINNGITSLIIECVFIKEIKIIIAIR